MDNESNEEAKGLDSRYGQLRKLNRKHRRAAQLLAEGIKPTVVAHPLVGG